MNTFIQEGYLLSMGIVVGVVVLFLLGMLLKYKGLLKRNEILIKAQEEKIQYLRKISAENEHRNTQSAHEKDKELIALRHTVENLEVKIKEGTKNQVSAMIEAQQSKRAKALERAGLTK